MKEKTNEEQQLSPFSDILRKQRFKGNCLSGCLKAEYLLKYSKNLLTKKESELVDLHLKECKRCRKELNLVKKCINI